jgi:uncharacterized membrane protein required for colicin V production
MTALALTVVLVILWGGFIAFGWWHGGWRQIVLLAAMLLSYAVLSEWAAPNGHDLSAQFHWSIARTTTGVALLYLLVGTFVLGFLGSFSLYRPRPLAPTERSLGAVMGLLNGGLLLSLVLRTLRSYAFGAGRGQTLHDSALSRFLIEDIGYLLLIALVVGGIAAVIGLAIARRDEAREMALLASVATPDRPPQAEPHPQAEPTPYAPSPTAPKAPPIPEPIYAHAPLIDWPASPPPGTQTAPPAPNRPAKTDVSPTIAAEADTGCRRAPLPARPQVPPRVPPPMVYPLAELLAASAKPTTQVAEKSPAPPSPLPPPAIAKAARPIGPPPGATHPAFVPPTAQRPPTPPEPTHTDAARTPQPSPLPSVPSSEARPPGLRDLDTSTSDAPSPVVHELAVTTQDVPVVQEATPVAETAPDTTTPATDGGTMHPETAAPKYVSPPAPDVTMTTAAIPTTLPPPSPPVSVPRPAGASALPAPRNIPPGAEEAGSSRTGYARVAVARQAGSTSGESPGQPQQSAPPEPLHPPLPTGPRVHPCPTCGYPVRDHARYCPNCGNRQGRP